MLVGYEDPLGTKGYRVWSHDTGAVYISRDVKFMGRMYHRGPSPNVSMLTVNGVDNFVPAEKAIVNLVLARQLENMHQDDQRCDVASAIL